MSLKSNHQLNWESRLAKVLLNQHPVAPNNPKTLQLLPPKLKTKRRLVPTTMKKRVMKLKRSKAHTTMKTVLLILAKANKAKKAKKVQMLIKLSNLTKLLRVLAARNL